MHLVTTAIAGAVAMAIVLYLGLVRFPLAIEHHLLDDARASLAAAGLDWAIVSGDGRDLHLQGTPPDAASRRQAISVLGAVRGLSNVLDKTGHGTSQPVLSAAQPPPARNPDAPAILLPPSTERSPAQAARLCQTSFDALLSEERVKFVPGKALVSLESAQLLQHVAQTAQRCSGARLEIAAHTDAQGDPADNFQRSQAQAEAVVKYLVSQGLAASRLDARGYGSQAPIASDRTEAGRERNRRIEITVLRGAE